jgi:hypothetical protein
LAPIHAGRNEGAPHEHGTKIFIIASQARRSRLKIKAALFAHQALLRWTKSASLHFVRNNDSMERELAQTTARDNSIGNPNLIADASPP